MATYEIWYNEVETFKGYFEAETEEQALELIEKVRDGIIDYTDIEGWESYVADYSLDVDPGTLKPVN